MAFNRKIRLAPLVEVIEPTPPLCRNAPIFGMTGTFLTANVYIDNKPS